MIMDKPSDASFTPYQKRVLVILALMQFTVVLDFMVISPLGDFLMKGLQLNPERFGHVVSAYAFSAAASGLLAAGFADKFDRKSLLTFFYAGFILGTLFCGIANTYKMLLAARIITGIFGGVIGSVSLAIVTDLFQPMQRGRVMSTIQMAFSASQVLGIPFSLFMAVHFGWNMPFYALVGMAVIIGLYMLLYLKPVDRHLHENNGTNAFVHVSNTLLNKKYLMGFATTAMLSIGAFMIMPFSSAFAINNMGITPEQLPWVFFSTGVSTLFTMPIIGRISDRYNRFYIFTGASIWAMIMVCIYTNFGHTPLWLAIMGNILLFVGIMGRAVPASATISGLPLPADRGAFMSINASMQQMAGGLGSLFAGWIVKQPGGNTPLIHFNTLGYVTCGIMVICVYGLYRVSQITQRQSSEESKISPSRR
jgi:predicted MFS family arabinose efflux permease